MFEQLKKLKDPDSLVSLVLGIAIVAVIAILIVNYVKGRAPVPQGEITTQTEQQQDATGSANLPGTHEVTAGETLWSIAEKTIGSGYNWVDIAKANNLSDPNMITAGQKLSIPNVTKIEPGQISAAAVEVKRPTDGKYTVQKGDSLWSVSVKIYGTGYRWADIAKLNNLAEPDKIFSGNVLNLP